MRTFAAPGGFGRFALAAACALAAALAPQAGRSQASPSQASPSRPGPATAGRWPFQTSFETPPPRAVPASGSACEVAARYVSLIGADRASEVPGLFAEDGEFIGLEPRVYRGRAEIASFYNSVHQGGAIPLSFIDHGDDCVMELAGLRPNPVKGGPDQFRLVAIDHFTIGRDRKIERLVIYFRLQPLGLEAPQR